MHGFQGSRILSPYLHAESEEATKGEGRAGEWGVRGRSGGGGGWGGGGGGSTKDDCQRSETLKINKIHFSTTNFSVQHSQISYISSSVNILSVCIVCLLVAFLISLYGVFVCVCACVRACVRACARAHLFA